MKSNTKGTFEIKNTRRQPQQQRSIDKLNRILDAATLLLANPTGEKITTSMIAEKAGIAVGSVYQFYSNIEEIKEATLSRVLGQIAVVYQRVVDELPQGTNIKELSEALIDSTSEFYDRYPVIVKIITASTNNRAFLTVKAQLDRSLVDFFCDIALINEKFANPVEVKRWVTTIILIGDVMAYQMWTEKDTEKRQRFADEWKSIVANYIDLQRPRTTET